MKKHIITAVMLIALAATTASAQVSETVSSQAQAQSQKCIVLTRSLYRGVSHKEVSDLQQFLISKGYSVSVTGYYGPMTEAAVKLYQKSKGVTPTGTVGPLTRAHIKNETCGPTIEPGGNTGCLPGAKFNYLTGELCSGDEGVVHVLTPNVGETWKLNDIKSIAWHGSKARSPQVSITLIPDVKCPNMALCKIATYQISSNATNNGGYSWKVGSYEASNGATTVGPGKYFIEICETTGYKCDRSDTSFTISASNEASVTVTSPNGGETWTKGTTQTITWNSYFPYPTFAAVGHTITLQPKYSCPPGLYCAMLYAKPFTIAENVTGGSYSWNVGSEKENRPISAGEYTVQVCQQGGSVCDSSNATITIKDSQTPVITSISPTSGVIGSKVTILGTGFTSDSKVQFNGYKVESSPIYGESFCTMSYPSTCSPAPITGFTVVIPSLLTPECNISTGSNMVCSMAAIQVVPGTTYSFLVKNGDTMSNKVNFTVTGATTMSADIDRNGIVNSLDTAILTSNFGRSSSQGIIADADIDLNDDNVIGPEDWNIVASNIAKTPSTSVKGDINKDSVINEFDASLVQKNFGRAVLSNITFAQVDLNSNGYIDGGDYNILVTQLAGA